MNIDYYFSLNSPWTYLGHNELIAITERTNATISPHPVDFRQTIFPKTGGLPVNQRPRERQAYRLQELERWRSYRKIDLNISPKFWPANEIPAESVIMALCAKGETENALKLAGYAMESVWKRDVNIADKNTLVELIAETGLDAGYIEESANPKWVEIRQQQSIRALERGVFGAPSYLIDDQVYWGQDRLGFVERHLNANANANAK